MTKGVSVQLYDAAGSAAASRTGLEVVWLDADTVADFSLIKGKSAVATTDASGWLKLGIQNVTGLSVGDYGFLIVYDPGEADYRDNPVFASRMQVADITPDLEMGIVSDWVRNSAWLTMPTITSSDEKAAILMAVYPEGNFVALAATGAYTVNWGDGSGNMDIGSGVTAERNIAWADAAATSDVGIADAVACTFQDSGDTVTLNAHGWLNGQKVAFSSITGTTGISTYTAYYIVNATTNTFKLATGIGGSAITLTTDGSGSVYVPGYRQVIITVVPNSSTITALNLHIKHSQAGLQTNYGSQFLDIAISFTAMAELRLGSNAWPNVPSSTVRHSLLERVSIFDHGLTNMSSMFYNCISLQSVPLFNTSAVTNMSRMFYTCTSLQSVPLFDTSAVTNMSNMFYICTSLQSVPLFNTSAVTTMSNMFFSCASLQSVPLLNTSAVTNMSFMLYGCYTLQSVPLLNTSAVTNMSFMLYGCYTLQSVPLLNTSAVTNMSSMFYNCTSLQSVPLFDTSAVTNMSSMFYNCASLQSVPLFNTSAVTDMSSMFYYCTLLQSVPLFNTSAVTTMNSMFYNCASLQSVPLLDTSAVTDMGSMFYNCYGLSQAALSGTKNTIYYSSCKLSATELDRIYANLATVAGKTITVTGNYGVSGDTPSIATAKGWTVTG